MAAMKCSTIRLAFALGLGLVLAALLLVPARAQDEPSPPLEPFIARSSKKGWKPSLLEKATLLDLDATAVLDALHDQGVYVETGYFKLVSTIPSVKVPPTVYPRVRESLDALAATYPNLKRRMPVLDRAQFAHLIAFHLERVMVESWRLFGTSRQTYEDYLKSHKLGPYMRQKGKFEVFLFTSESRYNRFADQFTGRQSMLGQRYRGPVTDALSFLTSPPPGGARSLNKWINLAVNNQAHNLLISEVRNSYRIPLWLDIGFAHWMEQREGFETNTYTFGEAGIKAQFANGDWRPALRKLVATARTPSLDDFFLDQTLGNYTGKMRGVCFGLVDYMIREHRDGFRAFCRGLRETEHGTREVFRESFHLSPSVFFDRWEDWARTNYAPAGLKKLSRDPLREPDGTSKK